MGRKIFLKRPKNSSNPEIVRSENLEKNIAYYRANPHRFIREWLGLRLFDFQRFLIYAMKEKNYFIYIAARGGAKSTLALIKAIELACLYPSTRVVVVTPIKKQAGNFIEKVKELCDESPNLKTEIDYDNIKTSEHNSVIPFYNGSKIFAAVHSENSLGIRANVLIVDEYVRCDEQIIKRVFLPFLSDTRKPPYSSLTEKEIELLPVEDNKEFYLSSIRHAEEWSYKKFQGYVKEMLNSSPDYFTLSLPYHFGYKAGFINRKYLEKYIKENQEETPELIAAELLGIPERGSGTGFFKFQSFKKNRKLKETLMCMTDEEYIQYKENLSEWTYYVPKEEGEIRILSMDIAASGATNSDNTIFFITRLMSNRSQTKLKVDLSYGESLNGINLMTQTLRAKQLFYELQCDYFSVDTGGIGFSVADACMKEWTDEIRNEVYPAWKFYNEEGAKNNERCLDENAVPVMYAIIPSSKSNHYYYLNARKYLDRENIRLPIDYNEAIDHLITTRGYYNIKDEGLRVRMMNTYVQTNLLISECINLEQNTNGAQGFVKLENKGTNRKDRMSSFSYNLWLCSILEEEYLLSLQSSQYNLWDFCMSV